MLSYFLIFWLFQTAAHFHWREDIKFCKTELWLSKRWFERTLASIRVRQKIVKETQPVNLVNLMLLVSPFENFNFDLNQIISLFSSYLRIYIDCTEWFFVGSTVTSDHAENMERGQIRGYWRPNSEVFRAYLYIFTLGWTLSPKFKIMTSVYFISTRWSKMAKVPA